jgi:hypothetical protein
MIRKLAVIFAAMCMVASIGASTASATSEYFYKENLLANDAKVSSAPKEGIYFVGAYKGYTGLYEIGLCESGACSYSVRKWAEGTGTSLTESFSAEPGGNWCGRLANWSGQTGSFTAEIRY